MKRLFLFVLIAVSLSVFTNADVSVWINDICVEFDVQPQIINDRTMVPLRKIFEELGATVSWEEETETVTAVREDVEIILKIGSKVLERNGEKKELDVPAMLINDRTLVPVRAISESFGAEVNWIEETEQVHIVLPEKEISYLTEDVSKLLSEEERKNAAIEAFDQHSFILNGQASPDDTLGTWFSNNAVIRLAADPADETNSVWKVFSEGEGIPQRLDFSHTVFFQAGGIHHVKAKVYIENKNALKENKSVFYRFKTEAVYHLRNSNVSRYYVGSDLIESNKWQDIEFDIIVPKEKKVDSIDEISFQTVPGVGFLIDDIEITCESMEDDYQSMINSISKDIEEEEKAAKEEEKRKKEEEEEAKRKEEEEKRKKEEEANRLKASVSFSASSSVRVTNSGIKSFRGIIITAKATGGVEPLLYKFDIYVNGSRKESTNYSYDNTYEYEFSGSGKIRVVVHVKDNSKTVVSAETQATISVR